MGVDLGMIPPSREEGVLERLQGTSHKTTEAAGKLTWPPKEGLLALPRWQERKKSHSRKD